MAGPNAPLTKAFISCGWRCLTVDWLLDESHDLSDERRQQSLSEQLEEVIFIAAAIDCSTKSRAREIPRKFEDGRPAPGPLRSEVYPDGLPHLAGRDARRVDMDNKACNYVLGEIQKLRDRGGGSVRENPARSLHWWTSAEVTMWESGQWVDTSYAACTLGGARCKHQVLRHNVEEIQQWPPANCHHVHDPQEWTPYTSDGVRVYPSKEEAEYTAILAFSIAVSASWWAARRGLAKLQVPRMPTFLAVGRREHWLDMDPRAMREWAMAPMAVTLGLTESLRAERPGLPVRKFVQDVMIETNRLPPHIIYVGRGSFHHRLTTTKWKSPWTPGHNCEAGEWHARYIIHVRTSPFWDALHELKGMALACDCPQDQLCEADLLVGLYFDATTPGGDPVKRGTDGRWSRAVTLLQGIQAIPKGVALPMMSQEALVLAFRKLFPEHWFRSYKFAMVEDLINSPPFCSYASWLAERGESWDGPLVPHLASGSVRQLARIGDGCQVGAMTHRAALPPLLAFNLDPNEHFRQALQRAQQPLPYEDLPVSDMDLEFVADAYASPTKSLRPWRQQAVGALRELKRRWEGVTLHLRSFQETAVQQVTKHRDVGLIALLMVLTSWADTSFPFGLVCGLPAVGYAPPYGIFPQQPAEVISMAKVLDGWQEHNQHILNQLRAGKDDEFLLQQSMEDADKGFCTAPLHRSEFLRLIGNRAHRLIPRCVITQSSGKQRVIDNGDTGGQSALSSDANKLTLCSPLRPAQHIRLVMHRWTAEDVDHFFANDAWETGQEDLPSAYRYCPMAMQESLGCVVVWYHHEWQTPAYQVYAGLLFGLPLAVTSFNRFSRLLEALARRFCQVLTSLYFDDATITDLRSSKGSGQWAMNQLCKLIGSPFADDKKQTMQSTGTFLGLTHDLDCINQTGHVNFWARERLHEKVRDLLHAARSTGHFSRGTASKLYGLANFLEQGIYGRVGYGGLMAIKARQDESTTLVTPEIEACFEVIEAVMRFQPKREFPVLHLDNLRFLAASDAAVEADNPGSGGFHLIFFQPDGSQIRHSFVANNCAELQQLWQPAETHIAQLELAMVLYALVERPDLFRNRRGLWFLDNVAAVMTLVRGRSSNADLAKLGHLIHLALFALRAQGYWEYVQSKSNWADDISRLGAEDPWWRCHGFDFYSSYLPTILLQLPFVAVVITFEFL